MNAECRERLYARAHLEGADSLKARSGPEHMNMSLVQPNQTDYEENLQRTL